MTARARRGRSIDVAPNPHATTDLHDREQRAGGSGRRSAGNVPIRVCNRSCPPIGRASRPANPIAVSRCWMSSSFIINRAPLSQLSVRLVWLPKQVPERRGQRVNVCVDILRRIGG